MSIKVQTARKEYSCKKCGTTIKKGEEYYRIIARYVPVEIRCINCKPKRSELATGYRADIICVEEALEEWDERVTELSIDSLRELLDILEEHEGILEGIADELEEKADNIEDYFAHSELAERLRERADYIRESIDLMDDLADYVDDIIEEGEISDDVRANINSIISDIIGTLNEAEY